jgi:quinol monooxygenase YgiN
VIYVLANVEVVEGCRDQFVAEFRKIVPLVTAEPGCLEYVPTVDMSTNIPVQDPVRNNVVTIVEKWESVDSLVAHLGAPHMMEYRVRVKPFVQRVSLKVLAPMG